VKAALTEIYKSGDQLALLKKWKLDPENLMEPGLLTVK
jgi:polar amino acid transport system substrate-binding protein